MLTSCKLSPLWLPPASQQPYLFVSRLTLVSYKYLIPLYNEQFIFNFLRKLKMDNNSKRFYFAFFLLEAFYYKNKSLGCEECNIFLHINQRNIDRVAHTYIITMWNKTLSTIRYIIKILAIIMFSCYNIKFYI